MPGVTPVEYMLSVLRDESAPEERKCWAAEKAAPYIHPKPQPIARCIDIELPDTSTIEGIKAALARSLLLGGCGPDCSGEAQSMAALVEAQRKMIEMDEVLRRIERLEAAEQRS